HDVDVRRGPERRRVDRRPEPPATGAAVTVRLGGRLARQLDLDRAAEATAVDHLGHWMPPFDGAVTNTCALSKGKWWSRAAPGDGSPTSPLVLWVMRKYAKLSLLLSS